MIAKLEISGKLEVVTGLHIGGSGAFSAIGAVDSPVIRDTLSNLPLIPGSSLKGKLRTLLARYYNNRIDADPNQDADPVRNLFGYSQKEAGSGSKAMSSRILFSDMIMDNWDELKSYGLTSKTEVKFENTINRATAVANPRQIERIVRSSRFPLSLIYELSGNEEQKEELEKQMMEDFKVLKQGFQLLEYDYLGGNGSRGYGKVKITDLKVETRIGEVSEEALKACQELLDEIK